ncbi:hypothetical protein D3C86_1268790 [compost metagenome]
MARQHLAQRVIPHRPQAVGGLGPLVLGREEVALQVRPQDPCPLRRRMAGLGDGRQDAIEQPGLAGHGGRQPARHPVAGEVARDFPEGLDRGVHGVEFEAAVDVGVDEAGGDQGPPRVQDLDALRAG